MPVVTESIVKPLLTPFHPQIRSVFDMARAEVALVEAFRRERGLAELRYPRTLADTIYDAMSNIVGEAFDADADVKVIFEAQSFKVLFYPRGQQPILARFKKGDDEGRGQNHPTQTVIAFNDPTQCLPGFPADAACVDITYTNDELGSGINEVLIVHRDGDRVLWSYSIDDAESGIHDDYNIVEFPSVSERPDDDDGEGLVTPKAPDVDTEQSTDE